ncbi:trans-sulfuration enzyme family protein [Enhygromyxa salina]|uniref:Methionine gamma-lyase n=1 Tax=Enhygromyxa salina TaxID=215803 RepID=A0A2S9YKE5_9BACT|nr:aminotransferase class I/II-fold pyridoxal phosphate-dependent enzyme [Enhygromyxa salina]PRQ05567.1 Methionine gamma-lyase [Enhygromyxa salina]
MMPSPSTLLLHPDYAEDREPDPATPGRAIAPPIARSTIHTLDGPGADALVTGQGLRGADVYGRFGTATTREAAKLIARLEHGEAALLTSSGMAAITTTLTTLIPVGGRLACADVVYGGTDSVIATDLAARGIHTSRFDACDPAQLEALLREQPFDLVWCESIGNPLLQVARVRELAAACRAAGVPLGVDATFAGGMAQHPLELGATVVVHSATKYLNGHSDVIAGAIVSDDATIDRCFATMCHTGCCIDPQAAWLLARGLRTLPLRWDRQVRSASLLAARLAEHPAVARVHHPSLAPDAMRAAPLSSAGAVLAFELVDPDLAAADRLLARLRLCTHATSLGGIETLICLPARTSHASLDPQLRRSRGISDTLLRSSVGIEDPEDLWADLARALADASLQVDDSAR